LKTISFAPLPNIYLIGRCAAAGGKLFSDADLRVLARFSQGKVTLVNGLRGVRMDGTKLLVLMRAIVTVAFGMPGDTKRYSPEPGRAPGRIARIYREA
jgi:hypothetical protein